MLTAEVIPIEEKNAVALALQQQGFNIISIGEVIIISGEKKIFEKTFQFKFGKHSKAILSGISPEIEFYKPLTPPVIPDKFRCLIKEVLFPAPPEFF